MAAYIRSITKSITSAFGCVDVGGNENYYLSETIPDPSITNKEEYELLKTRFTITPELLEKKGNKDMIIMHPLPRVGEIDPAIDADPRAVYLTREIKGGLYVRMALLGLVLGVIT